MYYVMAFTFKDNVSTVDWFDSLTNSTDFFYLAASKLVKQFSSYKDVYETLTGNNHVFLIP